MSSIHLVLGGIRSGKSAYGEQLASEMAEGNPVIYIATGRVADDEMADRIRRHQERRPPGVADGGGSSESRGRAAGLWCESCEPARPAAGFPGWLGVQSPDRTRGDGVWRNWRRRTVGAVRRFASYVCEIDADAVVVSSEVGHSLVATSSLGRQFQDLLGTVNQAMAAAADQVTMVVAGHSGAHQTTPDRTITQVPALQRCANLAQCLAM